MVHDTKDVPGYDGCYAVTRAGAVWSHRLQRWLKPFVSSSGYPQVNFKREGGRHITPLVHRLVAIAWVDNPSNLSEVNHIDGDKLNHHASNLEWCTRRANDAHARSTGLTKTSARFNTAKLTSEKVAVIKARLLLGEHYTALAAEYGVKPITLWFIKAGKRWPHVQPAGSVKT